MARVVKSLDRQFICQPMATVWLWEHHVITMLVPTLVVYKFMSMIPRAGSKRGEISMVPAPETNVALLYPCRQVVEPLQLDLCMLDLMLVMLEYLNLTRRHG
jgi:hypothetical protein